MMLLALWNLVNDILRPFPLAGCTSIVDGGDAPNIGKHYFLQLGQLLLLSFAYITC